MISADISHQFDVSPVVTTHQLGQDSGTYWRAIAAELFAADTIENVTVESVTVECGDNTPNNAELSYTYYVRSDGGITFQITIKPNLLDETCEAVDYGAWVVVTSPGLPPQTHKGDCEAGVDQEGIAQALCIVNVDQFPQGGTFRISGSFSVQDRDLPEKVYLPMVANGEGGGQRN